MLLILPAAVLYVTGWHTNCFQFSILSKIWLEKGNAHFTLPVSKEIKIIGMGLLTSRVFVFKFPHLRNFTNSSWPDDYIRWFRSNNVSETWPCLWNVGLKHLTQQSAHKDFVEAEFHHDTVQDSKDVTTCFLATQATFHNEHFWIKWPAPSSLMQHVPFLYQLQQAEVFLIKRSNNLFTLTRSSFLRTKIISICLVLLDIWSSFCCFYWWCWPQMKICCWRINVIICCSTVTVTIRFCWNCDMAIW